MAVAAWQTRWRRSTSSRPSSLPPWYRNQAIVTSELVFWVVFALFLLFRLINHDSYHPAWGGEKPMEFVHINAILRSAHFPPYDPWYADGLLNYYYYGMYLVAFTMKLTGIPSEIAFNLAQPTVIALLAASAFSVASAISMSLTRSRTLARIGGLAGVVLVSFSGNLIATARLLTSFVEESPPLSDYFYWFWEPTRIVPGTIHELPWFTGVYADLHAHVVALPITVMVVGLCFAIAQDGRRVALAALRPRAFPSESRSLLLALTLLALALGTLYVTNAWDVPTYAALTGVTMVLATRTIRPLLTRLAVAAALTVAVGIVAYALVLPFSRNYVSLYGEIDAVREVSPLVLIEGHLGVVFLIVTFGLSYLLSRLWINPPLLCRPWAFTAALGVVLLLRWQAADEPASAIADLDGLTVLLVIGWLMLATLFAAHRRLDFRLHSWCTPVAVLATWAAVVWTLAIGKPACALFLGFGFVAAMIWLMARPLAERFVAALIAAAMFVGAGVELVFLVDDLSGDAFYRMNTFFKFYNQIWIMLALASAVLIAWMIHGASPDDRRRRWTIDLATFRSIHAYPPSPRDWALGENFDGPVSQQWAKLGLVVSAVAIVASFAYPLFSTGVRLNQQFVQPGRATTLNALDWMSYGEIGEMGAGGVVFSYDEDREIVEWFNEEVDGSPVIAEASIGPYRCGGSRISIHTGLPVVVGWRRHESQQRGEVDLADREAALRDLYTSTDPRQKLAILERYRVEYVVVGQIERAYPSAGCESTDNAAGIAAFEPLVGGELEVAFTSGDSLVYRVIGP